jgi:hypothetical protein
VLLLLIETGVCLPCYQRQLGNDLTVARFIVKQYFLKWFFVVYFLPYFFLPTQCCGIEAKSDRRPRSLDCVKWQGNEPGESLSA